MTAQIEVHANGQKIGHIALNAKTGKRTLKHGGQLHDLTHLFHTDKIGAKLEEIYGR